MLIDEKIEIIVAGQMKKYYKDLGYNVPNTNLPKIEIYIKDLPKKSNVKIKTICSICGKINIIPYCSYTIKIEKYGYTTCKGKCSSEKIKQTSLKKYGTEHPTQNDRVKENYKQTIIKKYGVNHYSQTDEFLKKYKQTNLEKFGTEYCSQNNKVKEKVKETCLKKYGTICSLHNKEINEKTKQTWIKNYGVNHPNQNEKIIEKTKQTNLKKYGSSCSLQNKEIKEKSKQTCLKKYGVEHPFQNYEILSKQQKSAKKRKIYEQTNLFYQGTYEKDFLEKYINILDINNGPTVKYIFNDEEKIYFSDFYIESKNLIIEIKSDYIYKLQLDKNLTKRNTCLKKGYNFIFIINKDYKEFNKKIKSL